MISIRPPLSSKIGSCSTGYEMTEIEKLRERIVELEIAALHDDLTGLPNRTMLRDRFQVARAYAKRTGGCVAVAMVDVDKFKEVNDTLGHQVGDELLKDIAARLLKSVREHDTVARIGGDEFVVVASCARSNIEAVIDRAVQGFQRKFSRDLKVTLSIGIAIYPTDGLKLETLMHRADTAMYQAKQQGRNQYVFAS